MVTMVIVLQIPLTKRYICSCYRNWKGISKYIECIRCFLKGELTVTYHNHKLIWQKEWRSPIRGDTTVCNSHPTKTVQDACQNAYTQLPVRQYCSFCIIVYFTPLNCHMNSCFDSQVAKLRLLTKRTLVNHIRAGFCFSQSHQGWILLQPITSGLDLFCFFLLQPIMSRHRFCQFSGTFWFLSGMPSPEHFKIFSI